MPTEEHQNILLIALNMANVILIKTIENCRLPHDIKIKNKSQFGGKQTSLEMVNLSKNNNFFFLLNTYFKRKAKPTPLRVIHCISPN